MISSNEQTSTGWESLDMKLQESAFLGLESRPTIPHIFHDDFLVILLSNLHKTTKTIPQFIFPFRILLVVISH